MTMLATVHCGLGTQEHLTALLKVNFAGFDFVCWGFLLFTLNLLSDFCDKLNAVNLHVSLLLKLSGKSSEVKADNNASHPFVCILEALTFKYMIVLLLSCMTTSVR